MPPLCLRYAFRCAFAPGPLMLHRWERTNGRGIVEGKVDSQRARLFSLLLPVTCYSKHSSQYLTTPTYCFLYFWRAFMSASEMLTSLSISFSRASSMVIYNF